MRLDNYNFILGLGQRIHRIVDFGVRELRKCGIRSFAGCIAVNLLGFGSLGNALSVEAAIAPSHAWVGAEKIRAGYLGAKDPVETVMRMREAGQNTALIKIGSLSSPPLANELATLSLWATNTRAANIRLIWAFNFAGGFEKFPEVRRMVNSAGQRLDLTPCPLDAAYWKRNVESRLRFLAGKAREFNVTGAVVDPEMYAADIKMYRSPCYCDECLREFLRSERRELPANAALPADRAAWLKVGDAGPRFERFFYNRVRNICREIEVNVHAENPDFMIGLLQSFADIPFFAAVQDGFGTIERPGLGFSEETYQRGYTSYVADQLRLFEAAGVSLFYVPGLWVGKFPTENLAEQFYGCAQGASGYWVYSIEFLVKDMSAQPKYALPEPVELYWMAIREANRELERYQKSDGRHVSALRVRPFTPPPPVVVVSDFKLAAMTAVSGGELAARIPELAPTLRYRGGMNIIARRAVPVRLRLMVKKAGAEDKTWFGVMAPDGRKLFQGAATPGETREIQWVPETDGAFAFVADSGPNTLQVSVLSGQPYGMHATKQHPLRVNGTLGRLYFYVPKGISKTALYLKAAGHRPGRGGRIVIYSPDGEVAARFSGDMGSIVEFPIGFPREMQGKIWVLTGQDVTNDLTLYFDDGFPGTVSWSPEAVAVEERFVRN